MRAPALAALLLAIPFPFGGRPGRRPPKRSRGRSTFVAPFAARGVFSGVVLVAKGDDVLLEKAWGMASYELSSRTGPTRASDRLDHEAFHRHRRRPARRREEARALRPARDVAPVVPEGGPDHGRPSPEPSLGPPGSREAPPDLPACLTAAEVVASSRKSRSRPSPGRRTPIRLRTTRSFRTSSRGGGRAFAEVVKRRIYERAGMKDAGDIDSVSVVPRLANGYTPDPYAAWGMAVSGPEDTSWKTGGGSGTRRRATSTGSTARFSAASSFRRARTPARSSAPRSCGPSGALLKRRFSRRERASSLSPGRRDLGHRPLQQLRAGHEPDRPARGRGRARRERRGRGRPVRAD